MTMMLDDSAVSRAEHDYAQIAQISAIGSLADTVLRELISLEVDPMRPTLVGIPLAAKTFRSASAELNQPRNIWDTPTVADELLHFSGGTDSASFVPASGGSEGFQPWLEAVAAALEAVMSGAPSIESIEVVRREFTGLAEQTMRATARLAGSRYLPA